MTPTPCGSATGERTRSDIDGVRLRAVARQMPAHPSVCLAVIAKEISAVPTGNPQSAAAVAPDAPCALPRHGRLQDRGGAGLDIDPTEIVAGKGSEKHSPL